MSAHTCNSSDHSNHVISSTYFLLESLVLITFNVGFVFILYKCRSNLNWKTSIFVLNLSVSDVFSGFALLSLSISRYFYICNIGWVLDNGIQLTVSYSILITVLSYNSLFFGQFLAVQYPIFYSTRCTKSYFVKILLLQYILVLAFEMWKGFMLDTPSEMWFSYVEISVMNFSFVCNLFTYGIVLYVAGKRQSSIAKTKVAKRKSSSIGSSSDKKLYFKELWSTMTEDYWGIATAGLHLLIYVITFLPFLFIYVIVVAVGSSDGQRNIYKCETTECHMGMAVWFARGIADPLLHIIRNPKLQILNHNKSNITAKSRDIQRKDQTEERMDENESDEKKFKEIHDGSKFVETSL